ncbi:MAG: HAMP domain-containing sensor histidine kinase [Litorimonas sp.]
MAFAGGVEPDIEATPADLSRRIVFDRLSSATKEPWGPIIEATRADHPWLAQIFDLFRDLETLPATDPKRHDVLTHLAELQVDPDWNVAFSALLVTASHYARSNDIPSATSALMQALSVIPEGDTSLAALDAIYDANTLLFVSHTLNGARDQALWTMQEVVRYARMTGRKIDPFTTVNNLAALISVTGETPAAIRLLKIAEPHLDDATPGQVSIYHYTMGRFLLKQKDHAGALRSLEAVLESQPPDSLRPYIYANIAQARIEVGSLQDFDHYLELTETAIRDTPYGEGLSDDVLALKAGRAKRVGDLDTALALTEQLLEVKIQDAVDRESQTRQAVFDRVAKSQRVQTVLQDRFLEEAVLKDEIIAQTRARNQAALIAVAVTMLGLMVALGFLGRERRLVQKLRQSRDAAEEGHRKALVAKEAKERFLATMNHEMRTPLNAIIPLAELLQTLSSDKVIVDLAKTIGLGGEAMLALVERSVTISDGGAGYLPDLVALDPQSALVTIAESLSETLGSRDLRLTVLPGPVSGRDIPLDRRGFQNVARELIENAIKFTEAGTIEARIVMDPGTALTLEVRDTGPGIPRERVKLLFEPFSMADPTIRRSTTGAGLGLAFLAVVMQANGGSLRHMDAPGGGSIFRATFPLHEADALAA